MSSIFVLQCSSSVLLDDPSVHEEEDGNIYSLRPRNQKVTSFDNLLVTILNVIPPQENGEMGKNVF